MRGATSFTAPQPVDCSLNIGKVLANLQLLELLIGRFLYDKGGPQFWRLQRPLNHLNLDDGAPENPLTGWSSLSTAFHNYGDVFGRRGARIARREEG